MMISFELAIATSGIAVAGSTMSGNIFAVANSNLVSFGFGINPDN